MTDRAIAELTDAVNALCAALPEDLATSARFAWDDPGRRVWASDPRERAGVTLGTMSPECRHLAVAELAMVLSPTGLRTALTIMSLERELYLREGNSPRRNPERYYFQIYGVPGSPRWSLRWEGHHLSINVTVADGALHPGPCFRATNPARVPDGPRQGLRTLGVEEDLARDLVMSLDADQRGIAIVPGSPPMDTVSGTAVALPALSAMGITVSDLGKEQRQRLSRLCDRWLDHQRTEIADPWRKRIADDGSLRFAWQGGTALGEPHYYRIHGESVLVEWSNAQNGGNHVHAVLRPG